MPTPADSLAIPQHVIPAISPIVLSKAHPVLGENYSILCNSYAPDKTPGLQGSIDNFTSMPVLNRSKIKSENSRN
jgi:hypothetical protein